MLREDIRFCVPKTAEDELALARARVKQRRDGLRIVAAVFGGSALAAAAFALPAYLDGAGSQLLLPVVVVLIVMPGAALAVAGASSLIWWLRLRRFAQRKPHVRSRVHARHRRFLRARRRLHRRLRPSVRRAS